MTQVSQDIIIFPTRSEGESLRWVIMNVFTKTSLGVGSKVLEFLECGNFKDDDSSEQTYICWEIEFFSNENGLLEDPSRFRRLHKDWQEAKLDQAELLAKLKQHFILIEDQQKYLNRFGPKRSLLDFENLGNFHQQHGQNMRLNRRIDPAKWWVDQKFTGGGTRVRENSLYGSVQWNYLESRFKEVIKPGSKALDLGCGTGVYTNLMADLGGDATGIDPSSEYLEIAKNNSSDGTTFIWAEIGSEGALDSIATDSMDLIFICDALLFYFVPVVPESAPKIDILLSDIHRILKPEGKFICMEPHSTFYLSPWLGDSERPFTVVHEYMRKSFGIVPTLTELVSKITQNKFSINNFSEIVPEKNSTEKNTRAQSFAREFPLWHVLEMVKSLP